MKTLALLLVVVAVVAGQRIGGGLGGGVGGGNRFGAGGRFGGRGGAAAAPNFTPVNWGPKVYGPGAKNTYTFSPNFLQLQHAVRVAERFPELLVYIDFDGTHEFRDIYGNEAPEYLSHITELLE